MYYGKYLCNRCSRNTTKDLSEQEQERNLEYEFNRFCLYCKREHEEIPKILARGPKVFRIIEALDIVESSCYRYDCSSFGHYWGFIPADFQEFLDRGDYISNLIYAICNKDGISFPGETYDRVRICIYGNFMTIALENEGRLVFNYETPLH